MSWALIAVLSTGMLKTTGLAAITLPGFESKAQCEAAGEALKQKSQGASVTFTCVQQGSPVTAHPMIGNLRTGSLLEMRSPYISAPEDAGVQGPHEHCWHMSQMQHTIEHHRDDVCCHCGKEACVALNPPLMPGHGPWRPGAFAPFVK